MQRLLNLFSDDCVVYEPFGKWPLVYDNRRERAHLKGKSEIESFLNVAMMASDGFKYRIEFIDEPVAIEYDQTSDIFGSTLTSMISVLATFYENEEGHKLKERLTFHVISGKNQDSVNDYNNDNNEIKTLWIQFFHSNSLIEVY